MVPKRLKEARVKRGYTQERLGVLSGIDESTAYSRLSHYENGTHKPSFDLICTFSRILDVPECYFYILNDDFAEKVLVLYRNFKLRSNPSLVSLNKK